MQKKCANGRERLSIKMQPWIFAGCWKKSHSANVEQMNKVFDRPFFKKVAESKGSALGRAPQSSKHFCLHKDQEDRLNSPVDCLAARNPIKGFLERLALQVFRKTAAPSFFHIERAVFSCLRI